MQRPPDDDEPAAEPGLELGGVPGVLVELGRAECLELLAAHRIGRFAVVDRDGLPLVVPVNYVLEGETVVFRTHSGTKLDSLRRRPVAFQIDSIDEARRTGWSVLVQGVAHEASPYELADAPEPWTQAGPYWIQLVPRFISGRRFQLDGGLEPR